MRNYGCLRRAALLIALTAALILSGCSGVSNNKNNGPAPNTYLYVAADAISQLKVGSDGTLTPLSPATVVAPTPYGFGSIAVDPASQYLFAGPPVFNDSVLNQYFIGSDGTLTANSTASVNYGDGYNPFTFTPDGKFAIIPNVGSDTTSTYSMSSSGNLTLGDVVSTPLLTPFSAAVDPSGHFVYVSLIIDGPVVLSEYSLSSDGTLVPLAPSSVTAPEGARSLALSAQGFLYTLNQGGTVTAFWIDESTGQLANAGSFATGTGSGSSPISIAFDPSGAYAYVVNYADNSVTQFTVNGTSGALSMNGPDVPTGQGPVQVAVDPSGKFAFVLNETDGTISQFLISNTGRLTANGIYSVGVAYGPHQFVLAQR